MHVPSFEAQTRLGSMPVPPVPMAPLQADRPRRPRPTAGPEGPWWRQPAPPRR